MKDSNQQDSKESKVEKQIAPDSTQSRQAKEPIHQQGGKQVGTGLPGDVTQEDLAKGKK